MGAMDAAAHAASEEADGIVAQAQANFPKLLFSAGEGPIAQINPILRSWVNYFAVGHFSRCFSYIRDWVEKRMRCQLARARQRQGFGWKRWHREWLYGTLALFHEYRVAYQPSSR